ncbi:type 4b pilus protein PilO2 [Erwinia pyrifoliae]|uniref:Type 4b pilus protein PilO2 n=1 Tax=Erwinia pyrifoliae TaxID=79967 RepID=A0ABY5X782_ERWPY|nr:type 4b pilus protein PilO2 [Erwinia pyrifoliae]AUX71431.1 pilus assembly protein [Erwinia pyrifoliae]MCA8874840.1 pilus assembly protein [Erwinia pyrifoliae]MCT2387499.1 type 4b pilus protein PilO2 [Erwinia pyrifoliae]MCU8585754.1 type 4b pilus protein PilO2 [Erwinia pyrifoliae]UWS33250.1 type 4b pilus protein PilO2 [Erwinia pyrifoliae]
MSGQFYSEHDCLIAGKRVFIAGLQWQFLPVTGRRALRIRAKALDATHWVAASTILNQGAGTLLGTVTREGAISQRRQRIYSLALTLLPALSPDCYAIVPLGAERYCFIAVQQGKLSVYSDVTGSLTEIIAYKNNFLKLVSAETEWRVYAPEGLISTQTHNLPDLETLICRKDAVSRRNHMRSVNEKGFIRTVGLGLVICALFISLYNFWQNKRNQERIEAAQSALLARQRPLKPQPPPWELYQSFNQMIMRCQTVVQQLPAFIAQWQFKEALCLPDVSMNLTYVLRQSGTVDEFLQRMHDYFPKNIQPAFNVPGPSDTASFTLAAAPPGTLRPTAQSQENITLGQLVSFAQSMNLSLNLSAEGHSVARASASRWKSTRFTIITFIPPLELLNTSLFNNIHLRGTQLRVQRQGVRLEYTLTGLFYEN